jgi:4-diphosphocytidyl-2-C-methyl-D-erythritol kinase
LEQIPATVTELVVALARRTNDLYAPARRLMPEIRKIITTLEDDAPRCLLARMSGSGATCFGIYVDKLSAAAAADKIRIAQPAWWVEAGEINV